MVYHHEHVINFLKFYKLANRFLMRVPTCAPAVDDAFSYPASVTNRPNPPSQTKQNLATQSSKLLSWSRLFPPCPETSEQSMLFLLVTPVYGCPPFFSFPFLRSFSSSLAPFKNSSLWFIPCFLAVAALPPAAHRFASSWHPSMSRN